MTCCNKCFEVAFGLDSSRQVQGHFLCSAPNEEQKAAWAAGHSPQLIDNRWEAREAIKSHLDENDCQVYMIDGHYFTVDETGQSRPAVPLT